MLFSEFMVVERISLEQPETGTRPFVAGLIRFDGCATVEEADSLADRAGLTRLTLRERSLACRHRDFLMGGKVFMPVMRASLQPGDDKDVYILRPRRLTNGMTVDEGFWCRTEDTRGGQTERFAYKIVSSELLEQFVERRQR